MKVDNPQSSLLGSFFFSFHTFSQIYIVGEENIILPLLFLVLGPVPASGLVGHLSPFEARELLKFSSSEAV